MPLPDGAASLLAPLRRDPARTALLCDFDGTLAPIVEDPAEARPLAGTAELLERLAGRFAVVAVVSGRPAAFLADRMSGPGGPDRRVQLVGLYGMESVGPDGRVRPDKRVAPWLPVVAGAAERLAGDAPAGVLVEVKGPAVAVHWRRAPDAGPWAVARTSEEAARTGLVAHPGRLSVELRPPLDIDKGTVVRALTEGCTAACFLGDDLGDLPAFAELARRASGDGVATVGVAVRDVETAPEVVFWQRPSLSAREAAASGVHTPAPLGDRTRKNRSASRESLHGCRILSSRPDFAAPKNNSPTTMAGMNTSGARSRFDNTPSSPSRRAITIFVSSRNLPFAGIHALALSFDHSGHFLCGNVVEGAGKRSQHCPTLAHCCPRRQRSDEPQHLLLHLGRQLVDSRDNLVS